ncbi:hypothetical protein HYS31_06065 [Candidatus Woesearchaeota archaeon]|nr:hypothetical protein [Candidatus Woesearchaeota archaeon]
MPETLQFFPLDVLYKITDGKAVVHLYSKTPDGRQVCVTDSNFEPYFYVIPKDGSAINEKLERIRLEKDSDIFFVVRTETMLKRLLGKEAFAIKVYVNIPGAVPFIKDVVKEWESVHSVHEFDIPFVRRYLIDRNITPLVLHYATGEFVSQKSKVPVFKASSIEQAGAETLNAPNVLAFDIETYSSPDFEIDPEKNQILMVSFYGSRFKKVIVWKRFSTSMDYVEFVGSEAELIGRFKEIIEEQKPDILAGYFSDGFDLPYIKTRASKNNVKLDISLDYSELRVKSGKDTSVYLNGITHFDVFKFIRKVMGSSIDIYAYDLESVASEMLNEKKMHVELSGLSGAWDNNDGLEKFCVYNLHDSYLAYNLTVKMLPTVIELVKIVGIPIYDANRMGFSQLVEWYILKQAPKFNEIAPNKPSYSEIQKRRMSTYEGAFVFEPKPGLYKDIVVFDFRSLYPTIFSSHNIGPDTINCICCKDTSKPVPGDEGRKYWFCEKKKGFIPSLIGDLITRRAKIKEIIKSEHDERSAFLDARQNSLKLLANSFYGYLGFFGARWYSLESARSITAWGRFYIHNVIEKVQEEKFQVLYSDSMPYDRYVFIRFQEGDIRLIKIGQLYDKYKDAHGICTFALDKDKKIELKQISKVIRHNYNKKLLKIVTKYGSTIVTPQHSVYSFDEKANGIHLVDAGKLRKGDKLVSLTSFEVEPVYQHGYIFDLVDMDFGNYAKELLLYSDNLMFPAKMEKCPYCLKYASLASHVHLKHRERRAAFDKKSLFGWVGGVYTKTRRIPRYWKLDYDLAWLLGFYCAEGSVSDVIIKTNRKCLLSLGGQDKGVIERVKSILDAKTGAPTSIIENIDKRTGKKMFYYRVQCLPIVALFQYAFGAGKGSEFKNVPWFIFTAEDALKRPFLKGYLDGDGNKARDKRYKTHFIRFSTKSKELAIGLHFLLKSLKHGFNHFGKEIKHIAWKYRKDKPKIQDLRLQSAKISRHNFCAAEILTIEELPNEEFVYDLEVEGCHNFVDAEGMILVHNTDSIFITLDGKPKESAGMFAKSINSELPGMMELGYQGFYPSGIFVSAKMGSFGAKKKYALLSEDGTLRIKGFETVRRNWSLIAKDVQENVLGIILKEGDTGKALQYVKETINELRSKKVPLEKVIIHTQLQKDILDYAAKGPHVAVAQRLKNKGKTIGPGSVIKYVVTQGNDIIRNRSKLPEEVKEGEYDATYYIENQLVPSVERIFNVLGYTKEDLLETKEQTKLGGFF